MTSWADIELVLNGERMAVRVATHDLLVDFLRDGRGLTGTKRSCEVQVCGACTVLVDGEPVSACCYLACETDGRQVLTIEGLLDMPEYAHLEEAFVRHAAVQCGFCIPGMLLTAYTLIRDDALGSEDEARRGLSGNLCRCTGYRSILDAVLDAAKATAA
jgi:aerobic carbon-monoxide dehydrogenase small subunit